ncbi:MAG: hypothetical protein HY537_01405 [Deltaproteobacteria bacterium]|nr:hypothetical protein [Deltaproteobacteria bacterium]
MEARSLSRVFAIFLIISSVSQADFPLLSQYVGHYTNRQNGDEGSLSRVNLYLISTEDFFREYTLAGRVFAAIGHERNNGVRLSPALSTASILATPQGWVLVLTLSNGTPFRILDWDRLQEQEPSLAQTLKDTARAQGIELFQWLAREYGIDIIKNQSLFLENSSAVSVSEELSRVATFLNGMDKLSAPGERLQKWQQLLSECPQLDTAKNKNVKDLLNLFVAGTDGLFAYAAMETVLSMERPTAYDVLLKVVKEQHLMEGATEQVVAAFSKGMLSADQAIEIAKPVIGKYPYMQDIVYLNGLHYPFVTELLIAAMLRPGSNAVIANAMLSSGKYPNTLEALQRIYSFSQDDLANMDKKTARHRYLAAHVIAQLNSHQAMVWTRHELRRLEHLANTLTMPASRKWLGRIALGFFGQPGLRDWWRNLPLDSQLEKLILAEWCNRNYFYSYSDEAYISDFHGQLFSMMVNDDVISRRPAVIAEVKDFFARTSASNREGFPTALKNLVADGLRKNKAWEDLSGSSKAVSCPVIIQSYKDY